jgi:uncharacterized lipoprotein
MKRLSVILLSVGAIISGCAFVPHKPVGINPDISVKENANGQNQKVWVNVIDERPRTTLGTRGVRGIGSEISVEGDLSVAIRNAISDGLRRQGFSPVDVRISGARELRIEVRNLEYNVIMGFWTGTLRTECGLKGICVIGESRPYENLYRGEYEESILIIQSDEDNIRYINLAVSKAVNALLADPRLMQWLATGKQT